MSGPDVQGRLFAIGMAVLAGGLLVATFARGGLVSDLGAAIGPSDRPVVSPPIVGDDGPTEPTLAEPAPASPTLTPPSVDSEPIPAEGSADDGAVVPPTTEGSGDAAEMEEAALVEPISTAQDGDGCGFWLNRGTVATHIHRREPEGTDGPFLAGTDPIFFFLDVHNARDVAQEINVRWVHESREFMFVDTTRAGVGSRWRTWVERTLSLEHLGEWTVEVIDGDRCLVESYTFELRAPDWEAAR